MPVKLVVLVSTLVLCNVSSAPISIPQMLGVDHNTVSSDNSMKSFFDDMLKGVFGLQDGNTNVFQQGIENMLSYFKQIMQFDMFGMTPATPSLPGPPVIPLPSPPEVLAPPTPAPAPDLFKTIQDETEKFLKFFTT